MTSVRIPVSHAVACCATLLAFGSISVADPPLAFYQDTATFQAALTASGKTLVGTEDFEEARLPPFPEPPDNRVAISDPLHAATNNGVFLTGDILPGLVFQANTNGTNIENDPGLNGPNPRGFDALVVGGPGYFSLPDAVVLANQLQDSFDVLVTDASYTAFALHMLDFPLFGSNGVVEVRVFDSQGSLLDHASVSARAGQDPGFLGIIAAAGVTIARINIHDPGNGGAGAEGLHEIQIYAQPSCTPDGDLNGDGFTNGRDIAGFIAAVLANSTAPADVCAADFSGDGQLDLADMDTMVNRLLSP